MDSYRLFVGTIFAISVFLLVNAWQREHAQTAPAAPASPSAQQSAPPAPAGLPAPSSSASGTPATAAAPGAATSVPGKLTNAERVRVRTDFLEVDIDTHGGDLRRVELLRHSDREDKQKNFVLLQEAGDHVFVAQSGLIGPDMPNHNSVFSAENNQYVLAPGQNQLVVQMHAMGGNGVKVVKTFTFHRASYVIDVAFAVTNSGGSAVSPFAYFQLVRDAKPPAGDSKMVPTYTGAEIYTEKDKLTKASFSDIEGDKAKYPKNSADGWVALVQHYFLAAWLPQPGVQREFFLRPLGTNLISAGVIVPVGSIGPGQSAVSTARLFTGPQEQELLKSLAPGLDLAVDYGWLRAIAVPLFWILNQIHDYVGNWGVAIIILTILIKLVFYPLSAASYKSMAKMKVMAPKLQRLKERYGDDRQKMHQAMIELYKTEKINPLGGCLPIVVQIPVFIALYWVLLLSPELRNAPFVLWIKDLSSPDPLFILPVLMGATMFIQSWLNPTPPDPMQARLMKIMPIAFSVFFFFFPAGLVLYWLVNNVLSIAQQWQITRSIERTKPAHGPA